MTRAGKFPPWCSNHPVERGDSDGAGVRGWVERAVGKNHREVNKERLLFVLLDKVTDEVCAYLGTILSIGIVFFLSIELKHWINKSSVDSFSVFIGASTSCMLPKTGLFESEMLG